MAAKKKTYWSFVWKGFTQNRMALASLCLILFFFATALLAPLIANNKPYIYYNNGQLYFPLAVHYSRFDQTDFRKAPGFKIMPPVPYSYSEYDLNCIVEPPSSSHLLGTDEQGRDLLSRMIWGSRVSIFTGFVAVFIYVFLGIIVGAVAGYYGGKADIILSRIIEIVICFPTFFLILTILALVGPSLLNVMIVIGVTGWTGIARIVRAEFLKLREMDFVIASKALGARNTWIIFRHMLPNALSPVLVSATFGIASTILIESSLSFLGFGVQPPTPSWGEILSQSRDYMDFAWWLTAVPGCAIFLTITAYNISGEAFQDAIDPQRIEK
ncbi:MAG: ABC transporter permease [Spirochaetota bacterium]